jgi:fimbrial chaperone protein
MTRTAALLLLTCLCSGALAAGSAHAATFDVAPIMLELSEKAASGTLVVTNRSPEALRFHVTAFAWNQRPDGQMQLEPTKDIVFFPAMLTLNAKESRQIRVGTKVKPGAVERTYRVFVEELPPLARNAEEQQNAVRVLTKMGLPVFVAATAPKVSPAVGPMQLKGRAVSFSVKNAGNTHMRVQKVRLTAKSGGKTVHSEELAGWYVLAGGVRDYTVELPQAACAEPIVIEVQMKSDSGSPKATLTDVRCTP